MRRMLCDVSMNMLRFAVKFHINCSYQTTYRIYRVAQKNLDHHAVCEYNFRKLLLNKFTLVECRCQR